MYPHERSLVKRLQNKPFALVGVNSDWDRTALLAVMKKEEITWPSFWNGPLATRGPISEKWNVSGWPTLYVLDHKGVIRFKSGGAKEEEMTRVIDKLVLEAEAEAEAAKPPGS